MNIGSLNCFDRPQMMMIQSKFMCHRFLQFKFARFWRHEYGLNGWLNPNAHSLTHTFPRYLSLNSIFSVAIYVYNDMMWKWSTNEKHRRCITSLRVTCEMIGFLFLSVWISQTCVCARAFESNLCDKIFFFFCLVWFFSLFFLLFCFSHRIQTLNCRTAV